MNLYEYTYNLVRQIPDGMISSYGAIAKALGDIKASRAVGRMMNQNPNADDMPCFRIVYSDGKIGGFGLGINDKIRRLRLDNIHVKDKDGANLSGVTVTCDISDSSNYDTQEFSVSTAADGTITEQTIIYKDWEGTSETETDYSPARFTLSKAGYKDLVKENITVNDAVVWELELQPLEHPVAIWLDER